MGRVPWGLQPAALGRGAAGASCGGRGARGRHREPGDSLPRRGTQSLRFTLEQTQPGSGHCSAPRNYFIATSSSSRIAGLGLDPHKHVKGTKARKASQEGHSKPSPVGKKGYSCFE